MNPQVKAIRAELLKLRTSSKPHLSFDIIDQPGVCEALDKYRKTKSITLFIRFALLLDPKCGVRLFSPHAHLVVLLYKNHVIEFKILINSAYSTTSTKNTNPARFKITEGIDRYKKIFKEDQIRAEIILTSPVLQKPIIEAVCKKRNYELASIILIAMALDIASWQKEKKLKRIKNLIGYFKKLSRENNIFGDQTTSLLQGMTKWFFVDRLLRFIDVIVKRIMTSPERVEQAREIYYNVKIILGIKEEPKKTTDCLKKGRIADIIDIDRNYFNKFDKWKNLFKKYQKPGKQCAEIPFEGALFEYVHNIWNNRKNKSGLIKDVDDLRALFKLGRKQFIAHKQ
jgi:hypothetical protein